MIPKKLAQTVPILVVLALAIASSAFAQLDYKDFTVITDSGDPGLSDDIEAALRGTASGSCATCGVDCSVSCDPLYLLIPPSDGEPKTLPSGLLNGVATSSTGDNWYVLDNRTDPIVIKRDLYLHGGSPRSTRIVPADPDQPLFELGEDFAGTINIAGLHFLSPRTSTTSGQWCPRAAGCSAPCECSDECDATPAACGCSGLGPWFSVGHEPFDFSEAAEGFAFEMYDSRLTRVMLNLNGHGSYHLQSMVVSHNSATESSVLIDNDDADVLMVGVDFASPTKRVANPETLRGSQHHVRQKRGRLRMYAGGTTGVNGHADIRIDTGASEPHILAGVRSEGHQLNPGPNTSSFLYVPPSTDSVDIVIKGVAGSWGVCDESCEECDPDENIGVDNFINYNADGTLWLLGNSAPNSDRLLVGDTSGATIYAIGNSARGNESTAMANGVANLYNWAEVSGCDKFNLGTGEADGCWPATRFSSPQKTLSNTYPAMIPPPEDEVPVPLTRPVMTEIPSGLGMLDASDCQHMTVGDEWIQLALNCSMLEDPSTDDACDTYCTIPSDFRPGMVWIPENDNSEPWEITKPLQWFHYDQALELGPGDDSSCMVEADPTGHPGKEHNSCGLARLSDGLYRNVTALWLVGGGGSADTVIENVTTSWSAWGDQSVFVSLSTDGLIVEGLTLRSEAYGHDGSTEGITDPVAQIETAVVKFAEVADEYAISLPFPPSQDGYFHDVVFDGGKYAMGIALQTTTQSDAFTFVRSKFKNAKYGLAVRGPNALSIMVSDPGTVTDPTFENNVIAMGGGDRVEQACCCDPASATDPTPTCSLTGSPPSPSCSASGTAVVYPSSTPPILETGTGQFVAGLWYVMGATIRGTEWKDFAGGGPFPFYMMAIDTDTEQWSSKCEGTTQGSRHFFFDQPSFGEPSSPAGRSLIDFRSAGGALFLYPEVDEDRPLRPLQFNNAATSGYALSIYKGMENRLWEPLSGQSSLIEKLYSGSRDMFKVDELNYQSCTNNASCPNTGMGSDCGAETCTILGGARYCVPDVNTSSDCGATACVVGVGPIEQPQDQVCEGIDGTGLCRLNDCHDTNFTCSGQDWPITQFETKLCMGTIQTTIGECSGSVDYCLPSSASSYLSTSAPTSSLITSCNVRQADSTVDAFGVTGSHGLCVDGSDFCIDWDCDCDPDDCDNLNYCDGVETCGVDTAGDPACHPATTLPCTTSMECGGNSPSNCACHEPSTAYLDELDGLGYDDHCIPVCPATEICDVPGAVGTTTIGEICALPNGGTIGCPAGQTLYVSNKHCNGLDAGQPMSLFCDSP